MECTIIGHIFNLLMHGELIIRKIKLLKFLDTKETVFQGHLQEHFNEKFLVNQKCCNSSTINIVAL